MWLIIHIWWVSQDIEQHIEAGGNRAGGFMGHLWSKSMLEKYHTVFLTNVCWNGNGKMYSIIWINLVHFVAVAEAANLSLINESHLHLKMQ